MIILEYTKEDETLPDLKYSHREDGAFDLYSKETVIIPPHSERQVGTGICMRIPRGYTGLIRSRSGLKFKREMHCFHGLIDAGYVGEIQLLIANDHVEPQTIQKGERCAQMVIVPVPEVLLVQRSKLKDTERGSKGFGSTDS